MSKSTYPIDEVEQGQRVRPVSFANLRRLRGIVAVLAVFLTIFAVEGATRGLLYAKAMWIDPTLPLCRDPYATSLSFSCRMPEVNAEFNAGVGWDPYLGLRNVPNLRGHWLNTNARGYRGMREVTESKPKDVLRVVVIGGSTAMGYGIRDDETMPVHLENALRAEMPKSSIEVINAAMAGFTSTQELVQLAIEILDLQPDVVVVFDGPNDLMFGMSNDWRPRTTPAQRKTAAAVTESLTAPWGWGIQQMLRSTMHNSALLRQFGGLLATARNGAPFAGSLEFNREALAVWSSNLSRMAVLSHSDGVKIAFVLQPMLNESSKLLSPEEREIYANGDNVWAQASRHLPEMAERQRSACELPGTLCVDLTDAFVGLSDTAYIDMIHLNGPAQETIARRIAAELLEAGWLLPPQSDRG